MRRTLALLSIVLLSSCGGRTSPSLSAVPYAPTASSTAPQLVGYWAGWESMGLSSTPKGVGSVLISFAFLHGHTIERGNVRNGLVTPKAIAALHDRGIKVLLSIGGSNPKNAFDFDGDVAGFEASLAALLAKTPYDGIDFDDESYTEAIRNRNLEALIPATRAYLDKNGHAGVVVTYAAFDNPDTMNDKHVLAARGVKEALAWINVMCYEGNKVSLTERNVAAFGRIYPKNKLMLGIDVDDAAPTNANLTALGDWVRTNGYGGLMVWTINNTTPGQMAAMLKGLNP